MDSTPTSGMNSTPTSSATDPGDTELILDTPLFRVYNDGHADRLKHEDFFPRTSTPGQQHHSSVSSKDITIDSDTGLSARLFIPTDLLSSAKKLPVLIYFHGGGFIIATPFCDTYNRCVSTLVEKSNVVAVSVHYRRAPENPIPAAYEDSWDAIQWVVAHGSGSGPEPWLNLYADFNRLFLAGVSAGANIAHNMAMAAGSEEEGSSLGCGILGVALIHPFFWGENPIGSEGNNPWKVIIDKFWPIVCPTSSSADGPGNDDPRLNPLSVEARGLEWLGCRRVLVCVAEKDVLKDRGWLYYEALSKSGWMGVVEIHEAEGEQHCFHLENPESENAKRLIELLAHFFNRGLPPLPL